MTQAQKLNQLNIGDIVYKKLLSAGISAFRVVSVSPKKAVIENINVSAINDEVKRQSETDCFVTTKKNKDRYYLNELIAAAYAKQELIKKIESAALKEMSLEKLAAIYEQITGVE